MKSNTDMVNRAFLKGFLQGFGNIGQVYEPIVGGIHVGHELKSPASTKILTPSSRKARLYKSYFEGRGNRVLLGGKIVRTPVR